MLGLGATALGIATMLPGLANTWAQYDAQQDNLSEQKNGMPIILGYNNPFLDVTIHLY